MTLFSAYSAYSFTVSSAGVFLVAGLLDFLRVLSKILLSPYSIRFSLGDLMPNFQISNPDLS